MTPYEVLGVSPKATQKEITSAYRILVQIFHPDRFADYPEPVRQEAERRMAGLNQAYALARRGVVADVSWADVAADRAAREREAQAKSGTPWHEIVRQRAMAEARAKEERRKREQQATNGQAIPRAKLRGDPTGIVYGMGEALHTNKMVCRGCKSIQWLPSGWKDELLTTNFFCSVCSRLILAR